MSKNSDNLQNEDFVKNLDQASQFLKNRKPPYIVTSTDQYTQIERRLLFLLWANPAMIPNVEELRKGGLLFRESTGITRHGLIYKAMIMANQNGDCHATAVFDQLLSLQSRDPIHNQFRFSPDVLAIYDDQWWRFHSLDLEISEIVYCTQKLLDRKT